MKRYIKITLMALFVSLFAPNLSGLMSQSEGSDKQTEVVTVYEYKDHPITPNDYMFRTIFWGACFIVVVTVVALLRTMVRMEEIKREEV